MRRSVRVLGIATTLGLAIGAECRFRQAAGPEGASARSQTLDGGDDRSRHVGDGRYGQRRKAFDGRHDAQLGSSLAAESTTMKLRTSLTAPVRMIIAAIAADRQTRRFQPRCDQ